MSVCILLVYGFCLDFLRVLYFFYFAFIFAFLFNFMGIIYRLWLSFSTARIMAEVVNKNRDRNVRDSTLDSLCCRCCRCSFFFFFVLVFSKSSSCLFSFRCWKSELGLNYRYLFSPISWLLTESRSRTGVRIASGQDQAAIARGGDADPGGGTNPADSRSRARNLAEGKGAGRQSPSTGRSREIQVNII